MSDDASIPPAHLRVLSGGRAGAVVALRGDRLVVGRGSDAHVQMDPEGDLAVSARHAEILRTPEGWRIRDLESRNGTFRNDRRVQGEEELAPGDVLRFGVDGPEARFRPGAPEPHAATEEGRQVGGTGPPRAPDGAVTAEVKARTARAVRALNRRWGVAALLLGAVAFGALYFAHLERSAWERERAELLAAVDSLLQKEARLASEREREELEGRIQELGTALERSRREVQRIRGELSALEEEGVGEAELRDVQEELEAARQALARQQLAAGLDFEEIQDVNRPAVAMLWVEDAGGTTATGTAFAVTDDALMVTARHLLEGEGGSADPRRVGVQFSDSEQVFPGEVVATSRSADVALVQVENVRGAVPTVRGLNSRPDTLATGSPVASLGFPLGGGAIPQGGAPSPARPLLSAGVIRERRGNELEIQGFGDVGSSGSPVFDGGGQVVAMVYGGRPDAPEGALAAVASTEVEALLREAGVEPASR